MPGIREIIIYHYIIYELLSQHYWGGASLEEHVQLGLYYCDKWHNILLVGHCQKPIHSIQHPIIHIGLSMLVLQPYESILSCASSFHHLFIFSSLFVHFLSFCPLFTLSYLFKISWFICEDLPCFYVVNIFHLPIFLIILIIISSFCHIFTHPLNSHKFLI